MVVVVKGDNGILEFRNGLKMPVNTTLFLAGDRRSDFCTLRSVWMLLK